MKVLFLFKMQFYLIILPISFFTPKVNNEYLPTSYSNCVVENFIEGVWQFKIIDGVQNYDSGLFFIHKQNGKYEVVVSMENGTLSGYDVLVGQDQISFNSNFKGLERVSFVLKLEEDRLIGESYTQNQSNMLIAIRKHLNN